ncbi:MAG: hypothetical protein KJO29_04235 [Bacteroidia bacterium]|nr:hypothetical protein [Bacteroidia bacterium]
MKKAFILSSCSTCQRILKEVNWQWDIQNIKEENIDARTLDTLAEEYGSYEALFNKRAVKYRSMGLKDKNLSDMDYRQLILDEYTFVKRPVFLFNGKSFVGNSKSVVQSLKEALQT